MSNLWTPPMTVVPEELSGAEEDRESTGSSQSPVMDSLPTQSQPAPGSGGSLRRGRRRAMSTGRLFAASIQNRASMVSNSGLESVMPNSRAVSPPPSTSGRTLPPYQELDSNLGQDHLTGAREETGSVSGNSLRRDDCWISRRRFEFQVIELSEQFQATLLARLEWSELATSFGVRVELVNQGLLGNLLERKLILRIPYRNSGVAIMVKRMLLSMNFGEVSLSLTCCDGWTDIRSTWKLKVRRSRYLPKEFGSRAIYRRVSGIQN